MRLEDKKILEILLKEDYLTKEDVVKASDFAKRFHASPLEYLLSEGIVTKDLLGQAVAEFLGVGYADLNSHPPVAEQVQRLPEELARQYRLVLFSENSKEVVVATDDPKQTVSLGAIKKIFPKKKIIFAYSLPEDIEACLVHYRKALETRFSKIIKKQVRIAPEIIDEIIEDALIYRASDIHFEPQEKEVIIRFRVDGVLHEAGRIPKEYYENILNRIKVQAHLRIGGYPFLWTSCLHFNG